MAKGKGQGEGSGAPSLKPVQNPDTFQTLNVLYQTAAFYSVRGALDDNRPASSKALGKRRASGDDDGDDEQSANAGAQMQPSSSSAAVLGRDSARTMQAIAKKALISLDPSIKRTVCTRCTIILVPGVTAFVRTKPFRPHTHVIQLTCAACGACKRFPAPPLLPPPTGAGPKAAPSKTHTQAISAVASIEGSTAPHCQTATANESEQSPGALKGKDAASTSTSTSPSQLQPVQRAPCGRRFSQRARRRNGKERARSNTSAGGKRNADPVKASKGKGKDKGKPAEDEDAQTPNGSRRKAKRPRHSEGARGDKSWTTHKPQPKAGLPPFFTRVRDSGWADHLSPLSSVDPPSGGTAALKLRGDHIVTVQLGRGGQPGADGKGE